VKFLHLRAKSDDDISMTSADGMLYGGWCQHDVAGWRQHDFIMYGWWRGRDMWQWRGRRPHRQVTRHGDWAEGRWRRCWLCRGDLGTDVTRWEAVSGIGCTSFGEERFRLGGSTTAQRLMRGGSTAAIPPISQTLKLERFGDGTARQLLIWEMGDPTVGGWCDVTAG